MSDGGIGVRRDRAKTVVALMTIAACIAFFMSLVIKEDLKRLRYSDQTSSTSDGKEIEKPETELSSARSENVTEREISEHLNDRKI